MKIMGIPLSHKTKETRIDKDSNIGMRMYFVPVGIFDETEEKRERERERERWKRGRGSGMKRTGIAGDKGPDLKEVTREEF